MKDAVYRDVRTSDHVSITHKTISNRLQDLTDLLLKYSEIQLLSSYKLNTIKLMTNGVSTVVQKDQEKLWKIVYSEVPRISGNHSRLLLTYICYLLTTQMDEFDLIWTQLKEIDMHCWVIDPSKPKPYHLYRRIYLTQSLSVLITVDPHFSIGIPNIQFVGSESIVSQYRKKLSDIAQKWNPDRTLLQNLSVLLDINQFPQEPVLRDVEAEEGLLADEECCICFLKESDDGQFPNILCNNGKCNKHYHLSCLQKWLETNGNQPVFDQIHGKCPHCNENISCKL
ncbi:E3 ubiquitin-protein ligase FANCL [Belonocnema kinseyi]|uniref:E3 ubiquitin-protein ligase FANCL n=1 Tax=Belonocnema kinseyi TaxID=2817044 RepID=UPI00143DB9A9|nr:E3 ubiquitin-protein ligase FANCL [Belonocnema kinseyi]